MELKKITYTDRSNIEFIERLYIESFPSNERRSVLKFNELIKTNDLFTVYLIFDAGQRVGFITSWLFETFIYIEHFAIDPSFRSSGYGQRALSLFLKNIQLPIVLEVEHPMTDIAKRRISFYEHLDFKLHNIPYVQPPYEPSLDAIPMCLMTFGEIDLLLTFHEVKSVIYKNVYGVLDVNNY